MGLTRISKLVRVRQITTASGLDSIRCTGYVARGNDMVGESNLNARPPAPRVGLDGFPLYHSPAPKPLPPSFRPFRAASAPGFQTVVVL